MQKDRRKCMQKHIGWSWIIGFFAMVAANAQTQTLSPPATITQFDGAYRFVSSVRINETYNSLTGRIAQCGDAKRVGTLTVVNGKAQYQNRTGQVLEGTVGRQGELSMRFSEPVSKSGDPGEILTHGQIEGDGTVRARQITRWCNYDLIWQRVQSTSFPVASAQFDGIYGFISSTRVNQNYVNKATGQTAQCPERDAETLTIINGQAYLPIFAGTVGSRGELAMLRVSGAEGTVSGAIDSDGTVKAPRTFRHCTYDTIWQKRSK